MDSKHTFIRFLLFMVGILLISSLYLPVHYNMPYPAPLGPQFEADIKREHISGIEENRSDYVLIGDSVLYEGVDPLQLSEELGENVYSLAIPGSGTASWYLAIKNVVLEANHHPGNIVIFFRNTMLTVPQYRTTGRYLDLLDDYATRNEPLLLELAFINQMSPVERFAQQYIPLYSARLEIREDLDNLLRYAPASRLLKCDRECTDDAVSSIFGREVDPSALNQLMEDAAQTLYSPQEMDFERQLDESLLPPLIRLAQQNHINLLFIRTRIYGPEPSALADYSHSLDTYLQEQENVFLIDFSSDPRITIDYYVDSLHMNSYGKQEFTKILAEEFKQIFGDEP